MAEQTSTASSRRSSANRKPKKNQIPLGFLTVAFIIIVALLLNIKSSNMAFFWLTGTAFGFILQKGRFCFTASMRDPYLTGGTSITRAVIIAFAITTLGFTAIKYGYAQAGLPIPGMSYVVPISIATLVGAFLFGIGMVIAGGCASGTLMRVGEGFIMNMIAFVFFIIGSLWGAHDFGWWKEWFISKGPSIFLPDVFGWMGAVIIQLMVLLILYVVAEQYEKKRGGAH
ncbi:MAG: YeeE/YedE family protein [Firmicutes bacterium]|nr:YeeE/YedE family protein [Bacillota bacterium]